MDWSIEFDFVVCIVIVIVSGFWECWFGLVLFDVVVSFDIIVGWIGCFCVVVVMFCFRDGLSWEFGK